MWKLSRRYRNKLGLVIFCIGAGVVLTVIIPIWGWIAAVGIGLIVWGWQIMGHHHHW